MVAVKEAAEFSAALFCVSTKPVIWRRPSRSIPQGLKPEVVLCRVCGASKDAPFQSIVAIGALQRRAFSKHHRGWSNSKTRPFKASSRLEYFNGTPFQNFIAIGELQCAVQRVLSI